MGRAWKFVGFKRQFHARGIVNSVRLVLVYATPIYAHPD